VERFQMTLTENASRESGDAAVDAPVDAPVHVSPVTPSEDARTVLINTISWGAVLAGVAATLVVQLLLNMLGVGIGLGMVEPWSGDTPPADTIPVAAGLWWVVSGIVAALLGGMLAGRLSGRPKESTAGWHGITTWAVSTLIVVLFVGSVIAGMVGGAVATAGAAVQGLGEMAAEAVDEPGVLERFQQEVRDDTAGSYDAAALQRSAVSTVTAALTADEAGAADARERAVAALSRAQGIPVEEARARYDQIEQRYDAAIAEAEAMAKQYAEDAAEAGSRFALYSFAALVLGALFAWFGGRWGMVRPTVTADVVEVRTTPR